MIKNLIETLEVIRVYFLLKDCKKMVKKYYGKKEDELGKRYGKDADRLYDKYKDSDKALEVVIDTISLIEAYDKEAHEKRTNDFIALLEKIEKKSAPSGATNTEQGDETR